MAVIDRRGLDPVTSVAIKVACRAVATTDIVLAELQTIDGVALVADDRVLVNGQADRKTNGIYRAGTGPWTRAADAVSNTQWAKGLQVLVTDGNSFTNVLFACVTENPIVLDSSDIVFRAFSTSAVRTVSTTSVVVDPADQIIIINKSVASPTPIALCAAAALIAGELEIYDWNGNAGPITISPAGADKIMGRAGAWQVTSLGVAGGGGSLRLRKAATLGGWLAR